MGAPDWRCMTPIKNGDIPASYVSLPESMCLRATPTFSWLMMAECLWVDWDEGGFLIFKHGAPEYFESQGSCEFMAGQPTPR